MTEKLPQNQEQQSQESFQDNRTEAEIKTAELADMINAQFAEILEQCDSQFQKIHKGTLVEVTRLEPAELIAAILADKALRNISKIDSKEILNELGPDKIQELFAKFLTLIIDINIYDRSADSNILPLLSILEQLDMPTLNAVLEATERMIRLKSTENQSTIRVIKTIKDSRH